MSDPRDYFNQRCEEIGLSPHLNKIFVPEHRTLAPDLPPEVRAELIKKGYDAKILDVDAYGNIIIPLYDLHNQPRKYYKDNPGKLQNGKEKEFSILRYHPDKHQAMCEEAEKTGKGKPGKYYTPKGALTYPWISPNISHAYCTGEKIHTIILTEGYIKSICGWLNGLHIFGLSGIQNYRSKETHTIHPEILEVIRVCKVENVVILYDGDCLDINSSALEKEDDLYRRPSDFFNSARNIKELLKDSIKDHGFDVYFMHVNSKNFDKLPKGLDDIYISFPEEKKAITEEITSFSKPKNYFFHRINITFDLTKLRQYFKLDNPNLFYLAHQDRIKDQEFIFNGSKWSYDSEKGEVKLIIPAAAKYFFRVGDTYYEKVQVPNKHNMIEHKYVRRLKQTITDDHGKHFCNHVPKYKEFCNVPDHVNYQEVIHSCFNRYHPFEWEPGEEGDCEETLDFLRHIFGEQYELGLDYIQLLYQKPTQILPILCLVSKENATGKSTFAKWLKLVFTNNMAIVGNSELESEFNASYADKLIVCCDEAFIDKKKVIEKIKALSTADKISLNQKGKDHIEIDFFSKFIMISNNEENFINASEEDIRYWVRKVPKVKAEKNILPALKEEIPAFLRFMSERTMHTEYNGSRMWFTRDQIETEALRKVVLFSKPTLEKEIRARLREIFLDSGVEEVRMSISDIWQDFFNKRYEHQYIERLIKENLKVSNEGKPVRYNYPKKVTIYKDGIPEEEMVLVKRNGRPFVFKAKEFLSEEELKQLELNEDLAAIARVGSQQPFSAQMELPAKEEDTDGLPF